MVIILKRYSWALHFVTIGLASFLLAQAISTYIAAHLEAAPGVVQPPAAKEATPVATEEKEETEGLDKYAIVGDRNIFNSQAVGGSSEVGASTDQLTAGEMGPAVKTSLDIKLLGTLTVGDGTDRRSSATVSGGTAKTPEVFYVADEKSFAANVRLTKVTKDRIEFVNGSRLEYAELEDIAKKKTIFATADEVHGIKQGPGKSETTPPASSSGGNEKIVIEQSEVDEALANLDKFYTEVRIVPNFKGGQVAGMKVLSVKPGSIISKLGIRRGDILQKINGQELDVKRGMELFNELKNLKNFSIDMERGGQNKTVEYEIR